MIPTPETAQRVFDAHMETLHGMMQGQVTDLEAFNEWSMKVASAMTSTTLAFMYPYDPDATEEEPQQEQDWTDYESDTQPTE